ncbi:hypothetical protein [Natrialba taiwanensis]|uniref:Uncharacterized protein n=1 Tax=Natrialba taiwanensis DSM 12281 TaxID=1230458 RepID=M0A2B2_9EURY|nr:hypothetical protein [Natrialba taiwanensis]ELY91478.1 hypothetical protein C484_10636 [Natrialba taiwanensis DSM 12281]
MVTTVNNVELSVWHQNQPGDPDDPPDTVIEGEDLNSVEISGRAEDVLDEASIEAKLPLNEEYDLRVGDRVQFDADILVGVGYGVSYGTNYGGGFTVSWTGRIKPTGRSRSHCGRVDSTLETDATDFVGNILQDRKVTGSWVNDDVGKIIRDIINQNASEVDGSNIPDLGVSTDQFAQQADAWDMIVGLAAKADCLLYQDGRELHVEPIDNLEYAFSLEPQDWLYPWSTDTDDNVKNIIRVDSGVARREEQSQETQDSFDRVTESSRLTYRLRARKSEIHSVDLYVSSVSDESLEVRLQADEGGSPVAIDDTDSDIESTSWDADNLPGEGWQSFFFPNHTLPDRDPWLIIQTDGPNGHDIGVNTDGDPTFRSYYPHPLTYEVSSTESIDEFGARELSIERENLETVTAVQDAAQSELARRAWPSKTIEFAANSIRAHALEPGQIIEVDRPDVDAVGEFIVVEVSHSYNADDIKLETQITAKWRKGVLEPQN